MAKQQDQGSNRQPQRQPQQGQQGQDKRGKGQQEGMAQGAQKNRNMSR
jgi:hypothetical protein